MSTRRLGVGPVALIVLVALAGCAGLLGGDERQPTETLTPAPVPETTVDSTPDRPPSSTTRASSDAGADAPADYASLEPTCTRPPGLVVHIQVDALANNDPETNDGIKTTWRFAAPSNKRYTGPYSNFERSIETGFRPLLAAETITYGPLERGDTSARRRVTVTTGAGDSTTYRWHLDKQSTGPYEGCWMTTAVREVETPGVDTETNGSRATETDEPRGAETGS